MPTTYVNPGSLNQSFDPERVVKFSTLLNSEPRGKVNTLFSTDLYRFGLQRWLAMDPWQGRAALGAILIILGVLVVRQFKKLKAWTGADKRSLFLFALGFVYMAGEIQLLFFFQSVTGFVYGAYSLLTGVFMLGLAGGGFAARYLGKGSGIFRKVLYILAIAWPAVIGGLFLNEDIGTGAANFTAFSLNLAGGFLLGAVFNMEAVILEGRRAKAEDLASKLYSFDLMGSGLGAILAPAVLIPFLGHLATSAINLGVLVAAVLLLRRGKA